MSFIKELLCFLGIKKENKGFSIRLKWAEWYEIWRCGFKDEIILSLRQKSYCTSYLAICPVKYPPNLSCIYI